MSLLELGILVAPVNRISSFEMENTGPRNRPARAQRVGRLQRWSLICGGQ
jgi:hypothetical protein